MPVRYSGDIWNISDCEYCVCNQGNVQCHTAVCENIMCYQVSDNVLNNPFLALFAVCLYICLSLSMTKKETFNQCLTAKDIVRILSHLKAFLFAMSELHMIIEKERTELPI